MSHSANGFWTLIGFSVWLVGMVGSMVSASEVPKTALDTHEQQKYSKVETGKTAPSQRSVVAGRKSGSSLWMSWAHDTNALSCPSHDVQVTRKLRENQNEAGPASLFLTCQKRISKAWSDASLKLKQ
eukprot:3693157-Amphidinium_carterae.1